MGVWQALILRMSHPVPRHSLSGTLPRLLIYDGARRVNGCLAGTPRPTGSESHRSWQPILWMSHHTRTPCIQGLGPRIRGPGQSLETEVSRFGTPRG